VQWKALMFFWATGKVCIVRFLSSGGLAKAGRLLV
jgi:hypothetical protein